MTQGLRFEAIRRLADLDGKSLLDVGCGRADFLEYLLRHGVRAGGLHRHRSRRRARRRGGIEAAAEHHDPPRRLRRRADCGCSSAADVVILSGSLNTADDPAFYSTLSRAYDATAQSVVFNFLSSTHLAGQSYLYWRRPEDVLRFVRGLSPHVTFLQDYLAGDMTVCISKPPEDAAP
jgi:hypothetical protein